MIPALWKVRLEDLEFAASKLGYLARPCLQNRLEFWLQCEALSSNSSPAKKRKRNFWNYKVLL
jgi:hypothetical protein